MLVYWSILIYTSIMGYITNVKTIKLKKGYLKRNIVPKYLTYLTFFLLIFFVGMRTNVLDTSGYIKFYKEIPNSISNFNIDNSYGFEQGFVFISIVIKQFISTDPNVWLMIISILCGVCIIIPLRKYSLNFGFSAFLFITTTSFTWMINGMRQFICVAILFYFTDLILNKKKWQYITLVLSLSLIHTSCLIAIPVYFLVQGKAWNRKNMFLVVFLILILLFTAQFTTVLTNILQDTTYSGITEQFANDDGVNFIRVLVNSMPLLVAFIFRKKLKLINSKILDLSINMCFVSTVIYLIGTVTSGILIGRLPIYFSMYSLILLPTILEYLIKKEERSFVYFFIGLLYIAYFYYQMQIAWGGLIYQSSILGIY